MTKRSSAKPRRAVFVAEHVKELKDWYRDALRDLTRKVTDDTAMFQNTITYYRTTDADLRATIERQRVLLEHPWRLLAKRALSRLGIGQRKEAR